MPRKKCEGMPGKKQPYKVCHVGGRTFTIYLEYDEELKESYPVYPDFTEHPEFTEEGRPFATAEQESRCPLTAAAAAGF